MSDELKPLERLEELFTQRSETAQARVVHFSVSPTKREVTVFLDLNDDLFLDDAGRETKQFDEQFAEIERNFQLEAKDEKMAEKATDIVGLAERLTDPSAGILDDEEG